MPDQNQEDDLRVRGDIERHGWHVALIPPIEDDPSSIGWAFTIGLLERFSHPELTVFGLDTALAHGLLNLAGDSVRRGRRFDAGLEYEGLLDGYACGIREVASAWVSVFFGNAQWHYRRDDVPFLQIFWPDPARRLPWQEGFANEWRAGQPLLFLDDAALALPSALQANLQREGAL
jgi:hypothetical protein